MTASDLDRIEAALGVVLPRSYRDTMVRFPVPAIAGNNDTDLWDDASALIAQNLQLRDMKRGPWPGHMFFFGDPGTACANALDLREAAGPVWWVDHCDLSAKSSGQVAPSFESWAAAYVASVRHDLMRDGIDPDGAPE